MSWNVIMLNSMVKAFCLFPKAETRDSDTWWWLSRSEYSEFSITEELDYWTLEVSKCPRFIFSVQVVFCNVLKQESPLKIVVTRVPRLTAFCHETRKAVKLLQAHIKLPAAHVKTKNKSISYETFKCNALSKSCETLKALRNHLTNNSLIKLSHFHSQSILTA